MKIITNEEANALTKQDVGFMCFMGGSYDRKDQPLVVIAGGDNYYFEPGEKVTEEVLALMAKDAQEFIDTVER